MALINRLKPLTILTKGSILAVAEFLDTPVRCAYCVHARKYSLTFVVIF